VRKPFTQDDYHRAPKDARTDGPRARETEARGRRRRPPAGGRVGASADAPEDDRRRIEYEKWQRIEYEKWQRIEFERTEAVKELRARLEGRRTGG